MFNPEPIGERKDQTVYILGAGFSADAGAPLVYDFLDASRKIKDDPSTGLDRVEQQDFESVFRFRRRVAEAREKIKIDLDNIEELFGLVSIHEQLRLKTPRVGRATSFVIAKTLQLTTAANFARRPRFNYRLVGPTADAMTQTQRDVCNSDGSSHFRAQMYDHFAGIVSGVFDLPSRRPRRCDSIITFNYDLVLDQSLKKIGNTPNYCLPDTLVAENHFWFSQWTLLAEAAWLGKLGHLCWM